MLLFHLSLGKKIYPERIKEREIMSEQAPTPGVASPPAAPAKKSGGGCLKGCLGCGCLSFLLVGLLVLAGGGYLWWQGPKLGEGITESFSMIETMSGGGKSSSGPGFDPSKLSSLGGGGGLEEQLGERVSSGAKSAGDDAVDRLVERLEKPLAKRDIKKVQSALESWEKTRAVKRFEATAKKLEDLPDDDSVMTNFNKVRHGVTMAFRFVDLSKAYPDHIGKNGGDQLILHQTQLLAIYRAAQLAAAKSEYEPWEQAIADALIEDHDENKEQFKESRARIKEAMERGEEYIEGLSEEEQAELAELYMQQITLLPSAINRSSLKNWAALSDKERQQIGERFDSPVGRMTRLAGAAQWEEGHEEADWMILLEFMGP